ncbi:MAG: LysM peptidoglycan-binding domain-containing protein [Deltaproteobacteria bacterium]|nr:LysM peptidoglycan-binding domain-containing protein [Deltaproteobacteria bacterium]
MRPAAFIVTGLVAALVMSSCSTWQERQFGRVDRRPTVSPSREHRLPKAPKSIYGEIPVEMNERVIAWLDYFQGPSRERFQRYLIRGERFQPIMEDILVKEEGMPPELVYIALIESGFNTHARSRAKAVGPWQFIRSTGKHYGLRIDSQVDERRDPIKSTKAAAHYFRDLKTEFGDWYLAMAAYNAGEGKVRRAVRASGSRDFWKIANHGRLLRPETRDYVPKYLAARILASDPKRFGFVRVGAEPWQFETTVLETPTDLKVLARCAGVAEEEMRDLNPEVVGHATPRNYTLRLPVGTTDAFRVALASIPVEQRTSVVAAAGHTYRVRRGDTLGRIARRHRVSVPDLASANNLAINDHIYSGMRLVIPGREGGVTVAAKDEPPPNGVKQIHVLRPGETIGVVASQYGVPTRKLMAWNRISNPRRVPAGMKLKVYTSEKKVAAATPSAPIRVAANDATPTDTTSSSAVSYRVRRGDSLWKIAKRHGVSIAELQEWNGLVNASAVKAGDRLTIRTVRE